MRNNDLIARWHLAWKKSTPPEVLVLLAKDEDKTVRWGVARNVSTPAETLALLAKDVDEDVRRYATNNLYLSGKDAGEDQPGK